MSEQLTIDGGAVPLQRPDLGPRQQAVVDALAVRGGMEADEVGALIHASRGKHSEDVRCQWCAREGKGVLRALRGRGRVVRRRSGQWELVGGDSKPEVRNTRPGPATYNEFPDGF